MTDGAGRMRPEDTIDRPRAGNGQPHKERCPQDSAGKWVSSRPRQSPPRRKVSLSILFDQLAKAAATHDGEASIGIFGESH